MPRKKAENIIESGKDDNQNKLEKLNNEADKEKSNDSKTNSNDTNVKEKAKELSNKILKVLYTTYGSKDSYVNKPLYHHVIFEIARLSNRPIEEVAQRWPKFDIFTISEKVKETVEKELEENPAIVHQMLTNAKMIADMILAKAVLKIMS